MERMNEQDLDRMIAEGLPKSSSMSDSIALLRAVSEACNASFETPDPQEHLYRYIMAAMCAVASTKQVRQGGLTDDDIGVMLVLAFNLGHLRGSNVSQLEAMKCETIARCGLMTKEELLEGAEQEPDMHQAIRSLVEKLGINIKVIKLSDLIAQAQVRCGRCKWQGRVKELMAINNKTACPACLSSDYLEEREDTDDEVQP